MKYYLITQEEGNRIPYNINKNHAIDIRVLNHKDISKIGRKNIMEMDIPRDVFFPDIMFDPCLLVSRICMEVILMYHKDTIYKGVKLLHRDTRTKATYFIPLLDELQCISERTQYNNVGNRITRLVLEASKISEAAVFKISEYNGKSIVGREDFVESILRRGIKGVDFEEIETDGNRWY
ncbi:hypothetical protein D7V83_13955 [bacterium 0.1xD8-71]|nr:hypothetical protein D7V83_13955 [bacterium 0.1xD8-71]